MIRRLLAALARPRPAADPWELVRVLSTADLTRLAVVRSALVAAGIPCVVQGEGALGLLPLGRFGVGFHRGVLAPSILVPRSHAEEARAYLRSFDDEGPPHGPPDGP